MTWWACLRKVVLILFVTLAFDGAATAQDNAGIFFYGPPPSADTIQKLAPDATTTIERDESATLITVSWPDVSVTINIDPNWPRDLQLAGIRGLLDGFSARDKKKPAVAGFLKDLERTTTCYGSIIEPAYDRDGKVAAFLKKMLAPTGGYLFTYQSFYDASGRRIIGLQDDPVQLE
jgi:hypothetical protein